ncbi:MAG: hypothetical protein ACREA4_10900, partial [Nitrososphaera sp.]
EARRAELHRLRGAHNLWYVYAMPEKKEQVRKAIKEQTEKESAAGRYDFEEVLDECGYQYLQRLENPAAPEPLWQVQYY